MESVESPSTNSTLMSLLSSPVLDHDAWRAFVERYRPLMEKCCRQAQLQQADADDVTARVLSRLVQVLPGFERDPAKRFRGWLRTVVRNEIRDFWRERGRHAGDCGSGDPSIHGLLNQIAKPGPLEQVADELD